MSSMRRTGSASCSASSRAVSKRRETRSAVFGHHAAQQCSTAAQRGDVQHQAQRHDAALPFAQEFFQPRERRRQRRQQSLAIGGFELRIDALG